MTKKYQSNLPYKIFQSGALWPKLIDGVWYSGLSDFMQSYTLFTMETILVWRKPCLDYLSLVTIITNGQALCVFLKTLEN